MARGWGNVEQRARDCEADRGHGSHGARSDAHRERSIRRALDACNSGDQARALEEVDHRWPTATATQQLNLLLQCAQGQGWNDVSQAATSCLADEDHGDHADKSAAEKLTDVGAALVECGNGNRANCLDEIDHTGTGGALGGDDTVATWPTEEASDALNDLVKCARGKGAGWSDVVASARRCGRDEPHGNHAKRSDEQKLVDVQRALKQCQNDNHDNCLDEIDHTGTGGRKRRTRAEWPTDEAKAALEDLIECAQEKDPPWDDVVESAANCAKDRDHGDHSDRSDEQKYADVKRALKECQGNNHSNCLDEIDHTGTGGGGKGRKRRTADRRPQRTSKKADKRKAPRARRTGATRRRAAAKKTKRRATGVKRARKRRRR
jgi:hypothetical protein